MKKLISLFLCVVLTTLVSPLCFAAAYENYSYEISSDNTVTITAYSNLHTTNLQIPSTINGLTVTAIADNVFKGKSALKQVTIPDSVVTVGNMAFYNCKNLTTVTIGAGVRKLGNNCFNLCESLTTINLNNIEEIGEFAFYGCKSLTTLNCGSRLKAIPKRAFSDCELLNTVTFPKTTLKSIGDYAFSNCISITTLTLPNTLNFIGISAFSNNELLEMVTFGNGALEISGYAFENCPALLSVTLPQNVTSIGRYAFALRNDIDFSHAQGFSLSCYSTCTPALIYAAEAGIDPYLTDKKTTVKFGDVDNNKKVTTEDARIVLRAYAAIDVFDNSRLTYADMDFDGILSSKDAQLILRKAILQNNDTQA